MTGVGPGGGTGCVGSPKCVKVEIGTVVVITRPAPHPTVHHTPAVHHVPHSTGELPYTGTPTASLAVVGALLVAAGTAMVRKVSKG